MTNRFTFPLRVYMEDTDIGGIVYHANYLKYMERARTEWLASVGLDISRLADEGLLFVMRQAEIQYLRPAFLNSQLTIISHVSKTSRTTFHFEHQACAIDDPSTVYCTAECQLVCVNRDLKPMAIPAHLKKALEALS